MGHHGNLSSPLDELGITNSTQDVDDLLGVLFYQRKESVCDGGHPNDVGLVIFHGSGRGTPSESSKLMQVFGSLVKRSSSPMLEGQCNAPTSRSPGTRDTCWEDKVYYFFSKG